MSRILIILNPTARSDKAAALIEHVTTLCKGAHVRVTNAPDDARTLASQAAAEGFDTVVAAGGDGTINGVVNGLNGSGLTLGLLPLGTMNVFAAVLGLPSNDLAKCWNIIQMGHTRELDLPDANGHHFVQLGGVGLDAQALQETSGEFKKNWGPLSYVINAAQIAARKSPQLVVTVESTRVSGSFVLVGNGRFYGGPFVLFNDAQLDDGKLDVLVFKNLGYLDIVRYLQAILFGLHPELSDVEYLQSSEILVESATPVPVEVDGEVIGDLPVRFSVQRRALRVLAPHL